MELKINNVYLTNNIYFTGYVKSLYKQKKTMELEVNNVYFTYIYFTGCVKLLKFSRDLLRKRY
jgi:hypothetical protein